MATPAQAAATTVGAGSLAAAGAYGITQAVNGSGEEQTTEEQESPSDPEIPTPVTFESNQALGAPYTKKLLDLIKITNLPYLVKTEDEANQKWWKWAYENKFSKNKQGKTLDDLFNSVDDSEKLKEACQQAYTQEKGKYKFTTDSHLLQNISDYCTKGETTFDISEPKSVVHEATSTPAGYEKGVLSVPENRSKVVKSSSVNDDNNELWWDWAFHKLYEKNKTGASSSFANLNKGYNQTAKTTIEALNQACDAAYKKGGTELKDSTNQLLGEISKFCTTTPTEVLVIPTEPSNHTTIDKEEDALKTDYSVEKSLIRTTANKGKLIDPDLDTNKDWWTWSYYNNYPHGDSAEKAKLVDPFKAVTTPFKSKSEQDTNHSALNKACKTSYSKLKNDLKQKGTGESTLIQLIKKFCSPRSVTQELTEPAE